MDRTYKGAKPSAGVVGPQPDENPDRTEILFVEGDDQVKPPPRDPDDRTEILFDAAPASVPDDDPDNTLILESQPQSGVGVGSPASSAAIGRPAPSAAIGPAIATPGAIQPLTAATMPTARRATPARRGAPGGVGAPARTGGSVGPAPPAARRAGIGAPAGIAADAPIPPPAATPGWLPPGSAAKSVAGKPPGHFARLTPGGGRATAAVPLAPGGGWMFPGPLGPGALTMIIHASPVGGPTTSASAGTIDSPTAGGPIQHGTPPGALAPTAAGSADSASRAGEPRDADAGGPASRAGATSHAGARGPAGRAGATNNADSLSARTGAAGAPSEAGPALFSRADGSSGAGATSEADPTLFSRADGSAGGAGATSDAGGAGATSGAGPALFARAAGLASTAAGVAGAAGSRASDQASAGPTGAGSSRRARDTATNAGAADPANGSRTANARGSTNATSATNATSSTNTESADNAGGGGSPASGSRSFAGAGSPGSSRAAMHASTGASAGSPGASGSGTATTAGMNVGGLAGEGVPGTGVIAAVLPPTFARPDAAHTAIAGATATRPWVPALRIKFKGPDRARNARMYEEMKAAVGNDPGFRFDDKTRQIETPYTYRMIGEQYPRTDNYVLRSHLDTAIADAAAPRKVLDHEAEAAALFGTARYRRRDKETVALLQRLSAKQDFDYTDHDMAHMNERRTREMDVRLPERNGAQGARYLLHDMKYQGFTIGEGVKDADSKKYLVDNMGALKGEGVNTLYVGQLRHRDHQPMVDDWLRSPDREVSGPLRRYVDHSDSRAGLKSPNDLRGVLERAKSHGVRVVGIDDAAAVGQGSGDVAAMQRAALLNPYAEHRIRTDEGRGDGRYVVLVDQMHNNTHAGQPRGIAGLSQRLDIPAVKAAASGKLVRDVEDKTLR